MSVSTITIYVCDWCSAEMPPATKALLNLSPDAYGDQELPIGWAYDERAEEHRCGACNIARAEALRVVREERKAGSS